MMSARRIEVLADLLAIMAQLATLVNVHSVLTNREALDRATDLYWAGGGSLFQDNPAIDIFILQQHDGTARTLDRFASATHNSDGEKYR